MWHECVVSRGEAIRESYQGRMQEEVYIIFEYDICRLLVFVARTTLQYHLFVILYKRLPAIAGEKKVVE